MQIFIGADHRGYKLKEELKEWLVAEGFEVVDVGNNKYDPEDDFPDFALKVGEKVVESEGVGILLCGSGGMALAAKTDDNANVLTIAADAVDSERAKKILRVWLNTSFKTEEKYARRLKKIDSIEKKYFK
jgi:ribose 5-phosphate isomerase B